MQMPNMDVAHIPIKSDLYALMIGLVPIITYYW